VLRFLNPIAIHFREAVPIATVGLCVNLASAWLLRDSHDRGHTGSHTHDHDHDHGHAHAGHHADSNYRAAYVHVLADALTSVMTIVGLTLAWAFGWTFMDPLVGLIGATVILSWGYSLVRSAGGVLLDIVPDPALADRIRGRIEVDGDRLADLHLWQLGPGHAAMIASVVSDDPQAPAVYKQRLEGLGGLSHVTVEVNQCANKGEVANSG
jgi:cation diffusion facilitator family transporter